MTSLAALLLVACGGEDTSAPQSPAPEPVAEVPESAPRPCRPAGETAATLSIGPLDLGTEDFSVRVDVSPLSAEPVLNFVFEDEAADALGRVSTDLVGQPLPVVIDGETVMSPFVMEPILGGEMQLTGNFEQDELDTLARRLSPPCDTSD